MFLCGLSIDFMKAVKAFSTIFLNSQGSFETISVKYVELTLFPFLQMTVALWRMKEI